MREFVTKLQQELFQSKLALYSQEPLFDTKDKEN